MVCQQNLLQRKQPKKLLLQNLLRNQSPLPRRLLRKQRLRNQHQNPCKKGGEEKVSTTRPGGTSEGLRNSRHFSYCGGMSFRASRINRCDYEPFSSYQLRNGNGCKR
jgi:hypothetical protein